MALQGWENLDAGACIPNLNSFVPRPRDILDPSSENATGSIWPHKGGSISTLVLTSQTRMVSSYDPETILDHRAKMRRSELLMYGLGATVILEATTSPHHKQLLAGN